MLPPYCPLSQVVGSSKATQAVSPRQGQFLPVPPTDVHIENQLENRLSPKWLWWPHFKPLFSCFICPRFQVFCHNNSNNEPNKDKEDDHNKDDEDNHNKDNEENHQQDKYMDNHNNDNPNKKNTLILTFS